MPDTVLLDRTGDVAVITLNRPEGMNALTDEMKLALLDAVSSVRDDEGVRALVLTGSGRAFCVGQDLREHAALLEAGDSAPLRTVREHYNPLITMLARLGKPTIAAVNGTAAGSPPTPACRGRSPGWSGPVAPPRCCCSPSRSPPNRRSRWGCSTPR